MTDSHLQTQLIGQQQLNIALQNRINEYIRTVGTLQQSNLWLQKENARLQQELAQLKGRPVDRAERREPGPDAGGSVDLRQAFEDQQLLLAEWMVSQKAFKELAIELGREKGWTVSEVIGRGNDKKPGVLNDGHEQAHGTNGSGIPLISALKGRLLDKIQGQRRGD